jgi:hypothetical protein
MRENCPHCYVRAAELKASTPTLFDLMEAEEAPVEEV